MVLECVTPLFDKLAINLVLEGIFLLDNQIIPLLRP